MDILKKEWNIKPRLKFCVECRRNFEPDEPCFSALDTREKEWERFDFCQKCWEETGSGKDFACVWRGGYRDPGEDAPEPPLPRQTAETLFRRLVETDLPEQMGVIYILAVMLERSRTLKEIEVRHIEGGWKVRLYEHRRSGEVFLVTDPELRLEALDEVQQQVVTMLDPPAEPESPPENEASRDAED